MYSLLADRKREILDNVAQNLEEFCNNLTPVIYREEVYVPQENGVYEKDLAVALLDISLNTTKASCSTLEHLPNPPGFTHQLRVEGKDPNNGIDTMYAYIFWDRFRHHAVISFTGTVTMSQLNSDFQYEQVVPSELNNYVPDVLVHKGFYNIYLSVRDIIWAWWREHSSQIYNLYITGHSLGGALSTLCAFDFALQQPIHYSFAAPRSGNRRYVSIFNEIVPQSLRINNTCDVVPSLPPAVWRSYIYEDTGGNVPFTVALDTLKDNHTEAYYYALPVAPEVGL